LAVDRKIERVPTGIIGLDEMIEGGFKRNSSVLVVGGCGSGKSTFGMQFIYNGALKYNEPGVYVSFEEYPESLKENFYRYGWDLDELEKQNKIRILRIDPKDVLNIIRENYGAIVDAINDVKAKRVVIDSISSIEILIEGAYAKKENALRLCDWLKKQNCTSVIVSESEQRLPEYSSHGVIEFIVDGVIILYNIQKGNVRESALEVLKMRGTKHMKKIVPFNMEKGIEIFPNEVVFGSAGEF